MVTCHKLVLMEECTTNTTTIGNGYAILELSYAALVADNPSTPLLSAVDDTYGTVPSVWSAFLRRLPRCISVNTSVKLKGFH